MRFLYENFIQDCTKSYKILQNGGKLTIIEIDYNRSREQIPQNRDDMPIISILLPGVDGEK